MRPVDAGPTANAFSFLVNENTLVWNVCLLNAFWRFLFSEIDTVNTERILAAFDNKQGIYYLEYRLYYFQS